jgi:hypothetical protein
VGAREGGGGESRDTRESKAMWDEDLECTDQANLSRGGTSVGG